jgi:hypothetical protein
VPPRRQQQSEEVEASRINGEPAVRRVRRHGATSVIERREAKRFKVDWTIKVAPSDSKALAWEETGTLRDISSAGAYGLFANRIEAAASVNLMIQLPMRKENWISYSARILRVERLDSGSGIAFVFDAARPAFVAGGQ